MAGTPCPEFDWRIDLDALVFEHRASGSRCFVHRLAFRSLTGEPSPSRETCIDWFNAHHDAFTAAAAAKAARGVSAGNAFNLNSRDIRRGSRP
ncbi:hypothetical protein HHL25_22425 [Rhizobium sp. S-51]|uniref:DUF1488 family protein n=1 Tax=Rhizobium terricola TaxID=2728849 RepID=A0A7Y0FXS8_9HYPH|nr:hypothetical protein [Rhizobium terricola]NML76902.1 hypothetical protein [Rhizobium terricola]